MRAFIFSLDSFVAFALALVAIYSLIFFSSVPSAYYYLLTQGHYLTRDTLMALSTTTCIKDKYSGCENELGSILENIVSQSDNPAFQKNLVKGSVGVLIPSQFGYIIETSADGQTWKPVYNTATSKDSTEQHAKQGKKLSISSQVVTFGYSGKVNKLSTSPYRYLTCGKGALINDGGSSAPSSVSSKADFGIITCGKTEISGPDGTKTYKNLGNLHPDNVIGGGSTVPVSDVTVIRLTVFI